jgi:hypothetical protein
LGLTNRFANGPKIEKAVARKGGGFFTCVPATREAFMFTFSANSSKISTKIA